MSTGISALVYASIRDPVGRLKPDRLQVTFHSLAAGRTVNE
jgi:hypothetical protein